MPNVIGDSGTAVDWWFIYKVANNAQTTDKAVATKSTAKPVKDVLGTKYAYFDSEMAKQKNPQLVLSPNDINGQKGALYDTLSPLFSAAAKANKSLGWFCYNDEDRVVDKKGTGPSDRGHCKGVLAFDLASNSAFWLIHSVPRFPMQAACEYPASGLQMAQSMLCIQLDSADTAKNIAQLMFDAHGPNVNAASDLLPNGPIPPAPRPPKKGMQQQNGFDPKSLPLPNVLKLLGQDDPRIKLMQNLNGSLTKPKPYPPLDDSFLKSPFPGRVPFNSRGGQKFLAIAKNRAWGLDLYNDLVGKVLNENLEVETWENVEGRVPLEQKPGDHEVENMTAVNLAPIPYSWLEPSDHAKLAISDRNNPQGTPRFGCVGDINFTDAQEKRGGGTVAFECESLWNILAKALTDPPLPPPKPSSRPNKPAAP